METFLRVLNIILLTAVPVGLVVLVYYLFYKNKKLSKTLRIHKDMIIGLIFSFSTIASFYFGLAYKYDTDIYQIKIISTFSNVNAIPVITTFVFGWFPGLLTGFFGAIYRIFIYGFRVEDVLKWAQVITLFLSTGIAILVKYIFFKDKRPKWFRAIVIGFLIECAHALLVYAFLFANDCSAGLSYEVISQSDYVCLISTILTITLSLLFVSLVDGETIKINFKEKKFATKIRGSLLVVFLLITFASSTLIAYSRYEISNNNLDNNMSQSINGTIENITSNKEIYKNKGDYTTKPNENPLIGLCQYNYFQKNGTLMIVDAKNNKIASCNKFFWETLSGFINEKFYVQDWNTGRERRFEDKDFYKENAIFLAYFTFRKDGREKDVGYVFKYVHLRENKVSNTNGSNEDYLVDYYIVTLIPYAEIFYPVAVDSRLTIYLVSQIFTIVYFIIYFFIDKKLINSINSINTSLDKITKGDLNEVVKSSNDYEFRNLSSGINATVDTLKKFIDDANKRIDAELQYAKKIQQNSLPIIFPTTNAYDLFASMHTAKQVGGDFYDFFPIDNNHLFFLIADVSGKGIPAAMFMMRAKTLVKSLAQTNELTLDHIISGVNDELNEDNKAGMFVTAWFGLLNIETGDLEYVNAGHNAPLIKQNGKYSYLKMEKNCVLGVLPYIQYKMEHIKLKPHDAIVLYTDGVTEATSVNKELYGEERLLDLVNSIDYSSSSQTLDAIYNEVDKFQKGAEQADDITLLMITYKPLK